MRERALAFSSPEASSSSRALDTEAEKLTWILPYKPLKSPG